MLCKDKCKGDIYSQPICVPTCFYDSYNKDANSDAAELDRERFLRHQFCSSHAARFYRR